MIRTGIAIFVALTIFPDFAFSQDTKVDTGDNSNININGIQIIGYPIEKHERILQEQEAQIREHLELTHIAEQQRLQLQLTQVERQLADLKTSHAQRVEELRHLQRQLEDLGDVIPTEKLQAAKQALNKGETKLADRIFSEVVSMEQPSLERSATASFQRGVIAEQEVRWPDAAKHFKSAARNLRDYEKLEKAGKFCWIVREHDESLFFYSRLVRVSRREFGTNSEETARALNGLAVRLQSLNRFNEAEALLREAIIITEESLGSDHPTFLLRLNNLGGLLRDMGRFDEAEEATRSAIEIGELASLTTHPNFAMSLNNFALLLQKQQRFKQAEWYFRDAIRIVKARLGDSTADYTKYVGNLALFLWEVARFEEAEDLFREAMTIDEVTIGNHHPEYAIRIGNLALLLRDLRRFEESEALFRQAIDIMAAIVGEWHQDYAYHVHNFAILLQDMNRFEEASSAYDQAIQVFAATLGPRHEVTLKAKANRKAFRAARTETQH